VNIALVTLNFWPLTGGLEMVVHDLAGALHDLGHDVTVFAPKQRGEYEEVEHRYRLVRFGLTVRGAFRFGLNRYFLAREFHRLHRAGPFDVINAHSAHLATSYALHLKRRFHVPVVVTAHGADIQRLPEVGYGVRLNPADDRLVRKNLGEADLAVSISDSVHEDLAEILPEEKIVSIPDGISLATGNNQAPWLRDRLGLDTDPIVIAVGRNVAKKSFPDGVRAFASAARELPGLHFVHIGRAGEPLAELARDLGVSDQFHTLGEIQREQVLAAYREADIFFSPAAMESFGIVTFEAMAAGLPCLVSDGPGNRDAVDDDVNGLLVPVGDTEAMAAAIVDLCRDKSKRARLATAARESVTRFAWPVVAGEYAKLFSQLAAGHTPGTGDGSRPFDPKT